MKKWYKSKTLWANAGALVTAVGLYFETGSLAALFPAGLALLNVALRLVTTKSVT